jgi:hypothetical protein
MQKATFILALAALFVSLLALLRPPLPMAHAQTPPGDAWQAERTYPPLVFHSRATLDCAISSTKNGRQVMTTVAGQGFTFDTPMLPIKDGSVKVQTPGMHYKFNAFPTASIPATFQGIGHGTITAMKAEVEVDVKRYRQPGGPGTDIKFQAADINADGAYVEFTGVFVRDADAKRFPFRVLFGSVTAGGGDVFPATRAPETAIMSKSVTLGTRAQPATVTTALYEAEDDVPALK